jgi:hypothetical protein
MSSYVEGFRSGSNTINLRWGDFLTVVTAKHLAIQYTAAVDSYTIWAVDGPDTYVCALVFAAASANYPFPYPDGYTATQNNTDVGVFTATYLAGANTVALSSVGATGATAPLSANLIGIEVSGDLQAVSASNPLPITGTIMAPNPSVSTIGAATPGYATYIGGRDATGSLSAPGIADAGSAATTSQNALVVALSPSSPLPAGSNALGSVSISSGSVTVSSGTITSITDPVAVTGTFWQATQPVSGTVTANAGTGTFAISAASLPLPTGAATQTTLASILTNTPALGQATMAGSSPVVIASDQSAIPVTLTSTTVTGTVAVTQSTSPWIVAGGGTAGAPGTAVLTVQGISGGTAIPISGTVTANNASVSATGSGVPADATYIGGLSTGGYLTAPGITLASTAATAAQQALVVALSPNSPVTVSSSLLADRIVTGTISALSGAVTISCQGLGTVGITITGTWVGSLTFEGTIDGTNWFDMFPLEGVLNNDIFFVSPVTSANGQFFVSAAGLFEFRVIATAYTSGTATVTLEGNQAVAAITTVNIQGNGNGAEVGGVYSWFTNDISDGSAAGGTASAYSSLAGGIYNSSPPALSSGQQASLQLDSSGNLKVNAGTFTSTLTADRIAGPTSASMSSTVLSMSTQGVGTVGVTVTGTWSGTLTFQGTIDGTNWFNVNAAMSPLLGTNAATSATTAFNGQYFLPTAGLNEVRVLFARTGGTVTVTLEGNQASNAIAVFQGAGNGQSASWLVADVADSGASNAGAPTYATLTAAVYNSSAPTVTSGNQNALQIDASANLLVNLKTALPAGSNTIGSVNQGTSPWIVAGGGTAGSPGTAVLTIQGISGGTAIPISGTVTANNASVGTVGANAPTSDTQIGGISSGGNLVTPGVTLTGAAATTTQQALIVALSPNSPLPAGSNALGSVSVTGTVTVSGTVAVTQSTSPWVTQDTSDGSVSGGTAGTTSLLAGLVHHTAAPTLTNGQQASLQGDASGNLLVNLNTPLPAGSNLIGSVSISTPNTATYRAATFTLTTAATPTDILTIQGSSTKTVTITRISISGTQTQAGNALVRLIKRSTANTGGTAAALTNVPLDSNNSAATAVVSAYTANATLLGTATGDIDDVQVFVPDATTNPAATVLNFGTYAQAAVLRGTSQFLCLNLNGVTMTGNGLNISVEWTEM